MDAAPFTVADAALFAGVRDAGDWTGKMGAVYTLATSCGYCGCSVAHCAASEVTDGPGLAHSASIGW